MTTRLMTSTTSRMAATNPPTSQRGVLALGFLAFEKLRAHISNPLN